MAFRHLETTGDSVARDWSKLATCGGVVAVVSYVVMMVVSSFEVTSVDVRCPLFVFVSFFQKKKKQIFVGFDLETTTMVRTRAVHT